MAAFIVLVPAPVLGPASWRPVAAELSKVGPHVVVPSLAGFSAGGPAYAPRLIRLCAEQIALAVRSAREAVPPGAQAGPQPEAPGAARHVVLVVHSGAGPFAEHLAAGVMADRVTTVFADSGLPARPGPSQVVDAAFLPYLREIARDGVVPPWDQWWPGVEPSELFPNETAREAVLADARPLPLALFEETLPPVPTPPVPAPSLPAQSQPAPSQPAQSPLPASSSPPWSTPQSARTPEPIRDQGYLLFSDPYRREAAEARRLGWPVAELAGSHLHMLVNPAAVAAAIIALATPS